MKTFTQIFVDGPLTCIDTLPGIFLPPLDSLPLPLYPPSMPEVAELPPPPKRPVPHGLTPFNSTTAAIAARRRHDAAKVRRRAETATLLQAAANRTLPAQQERLNLLAEQIERTRSALNDKRLDYCEHCERAGLQPHHRAALLRALCELLDQQRIARGEPLPGSRRPREDREPAQRSGAWLVEAAPEAVAIPPDTRAVSLPPSPQAAALPPAVPVQPEPAPQHTTMPAQPVDQSNGTGI